MHLTCCIADVFSCLGLYKAAPQGEAFVPGLEFAGEVLHVAPQQDATGAAGAAHGAALEEPLRPGDRVMGVIR